MNSRDSLLATLRRQIVDQVTLPEVVEGDWLTYDDPVAKFAEMVAFSGGLCEEIRSLDELPERLGRFDQFRNASRVYSNVPSVAGTVDLDQVPDAHELETLDFVVFQGEMAIAENGAIWVTDRQLRHRVVFFITQFLALVVRRETIVNNMHEAYSKISIPKPGFGLFLSGPSKTADIEQSLVIGAHGCRELQVYVI